MRTILPVLSIFLTSLVVAQQPHWISGRTDNQTLNKQFEAGLITSATLKLAADFCHAGVDLNGQTVLTVEPYSATVELEVTSHLVQGANQLSVRVERPCGPQAVAVSLTLDGVDGKRAFIVTDASWTSPEDAIDDLGLVAPELWGIGRRSAAIAPFENYEQWRIALNGADGPPITAPDGFEVTRLRQAQEGEGSWISMAFDPKGRLTISREDRGLLRMTLDDSRRSIAQVETINDDLQECRGLLYAYDALYANANNSKGMYRLRDTDGDDRLDEIRLLREFPGRVGHGRNDLVLGKDGLIYSIHGDAVDLPKDNVVDHTSPFREARRGKTTSEGYLIRTDRDGQQWEVLCAGLRNPYGIGVHSSGDLFTYDADAEFDMGSPWYRPTRIVQLRPGADYGWRGVTGQWPPYFPDHSDNALPTLDIGKGSPTAVAFGIPSWPSPYDKALFILDWAYGRMLAVHLAPRGAGYRAAAETFLQGRPLNLTDLAYGPDGALYLITGGRKTQSALYRIAYVGPTIERPPVSQHEQECAAHAATARAMRQRLETTNISIDFAWQHLDSPDPFVQYAARTAIERQPIEAWRERALAETKPTAALAALTAVVRSGQDDAVQAKLATFQPAKLNLGQQLVLAHLCATASADWPMPKSAGASPWGTSVRLRREICRLMPNTKNTVESLLSSDLQEDRFYGLFLLRNQRDGWTPELRSEYFTALADAERFVAGEGLPKFLAHLREESLATLSAEQRPQYEKLLTPEMDDAPVAITRPIVKAWTLDDLASQLDHRGDRARGETVFREAQCLRCHRVGARGPAVGPDLTHVARRFSRRDMLESILTPSKVVAEHYRNVQVETKDGRSILGRVLIEGDYRSETMRIATDPLRPSQIVELNKRDIQEYRLSETSPMPSGLLDRFTIEEVVDLLAYLESGGNR